MLVAIPAVACLGYLCFNALTGMRMFPISFFIGKGGTAMVVWFQCPYGHEDVSNIAAAQYQDALNMNSFNALTGMRMFPITLIEGLVEENNVYVCFNALTGMRMFPMATARCCSDKTTRRSFQCPYGHEDVSNDETEYAWGSGTKSGFQCPYGHEDVSNGSG